MGNPGELKYTEEHEWLKIEGKSVTFGITDHAQELLSDIVFVELPEVGKEIAPGDSGAVLESVKSVSDVFSPMGGKITEVNEELEDNPELVNEDPFGKGWIFKMELKDETGLDSLLSAEAYDQLIEE